MTLQEAEPGAEPHGRREGSGVPVLRRCHQPNAQPKFLVDSCAKFLIPSAIYVYIIIDTV